VADFGTERYRSVACIDNYMNLMEAMDHCQIHYPGYGGGILLEKGFNSDQENLDFLNLLNFFRTTITSVYWYGVPIPMQLP
jgi:hypothetical protein